MQNCHRYDQNGDSSAGAVATKDLAWRGIQTHARHASPSYYPLAICTRPFQRTDDAPLQEVLFRLADNDGQRSTAQILLNRIYGQKGFGSSHSLVTERKSATFMASSNEEVFGTLTLTVDSTAGLALDQTFSKEVDSFRKMSESSICELTKFAFDPSPRSRPLLAGLFHLIYIFGTSHFDCTHLLIEVNPRHVRFYEMMLGFSKVGDPRANELVGAPAQLMWITVAQIGESIAKYAGKPIHRERSLYPYFFSLSEEHGIRGRLQRDHGILSCRSAPNVKYGTSAARLS